MTNDRQEYLPCAYGESPSGLFPEAMWENGFIEEKVDGIKDGGDSVYCSCGCGESRLASDFSHRG